MFKLLSSERGEEGYGRKGVFYLLNIFLVCLYLLFIF